MDEGEMKIMGEMKILCEGKGKKNKKEEEKKFWKKGEMKGEKHWEVDKRTII